MHAPPTATRRSGPRRTHGIMARLVRLAAGVLVVTLVIGALTALSADDAKTHPHKVCIHDELQQSLLDSVAQQGLAPQRVSRVGLPYVASATAAPAAQVGGVDFALAGDSAPDVTRSAEWGELRITVSAEELTDPAYHCATVGQVISNHIDDYVTCTADDIMTAEKLDILMNYLIPEALQMHKDRLQVQQVQGTWKVARMTSYCGRFKVPEEHFTTGLSNTDFVLYVASVPTSPGVLAWANTCQVFSNDQPAVGVINIPAATITERYDHLMVHAVTHEIAHSLGFSNAFFTNTGIGQFVTGVRGNPDTVPVINSPTVVAKAREHYGCDDVTYVELEDAGGSGTMGSHWKIRNAQDELMAGISGVAYYTSLTLSAFEDLGYYKANYSNAETMKWGKDVGCAFLTGKCVVDNVTQFPSMYCDKDENVYRCHTARLNLGSCEVTDYTFDLPDYLQYFTVPSVGGSADYYDYCPYIVRSPIGSCTQAASSASPFVSAFNTFSMASRCIDGTFTPKSTGGATVTAHLGMCTNVACNTADKTYSIQVYGNGAYIPCTPGATISLDTVSDAFEAGGNITCPPYLEVCQSNVKGAMDYESMTNSGSGSSRPAPVEPSGSGSGSSAATTAPSPTRDGSAAADRIAPRTAAVALLALAVAAACV
uniref:Leishmanolysin homolog n=1 Tax=Crithidia fasciculata TaxID=5656 RepID=GP63_CRIFA|nr:RecName: Full=Leishmanolysin homolog; AltName: Full=Cell surface protease; AltName: Full=Major surface glycoprotein; AltName: Full=Protein gp63; Flags: Precursor [Crithidia fasciculata]